MSLFSHLPFLILSLLISQTTPLTLTVVNNCPFTIWPAIQPNSGHPVLESGGFTLETLQFHSFSAPECSWSGRLWARTNCSTESNRFSCETGDCGDHIQCNGAGGSTPVTLAQISLLNGRSSYGVSLVDGFNLPMTVTPQGGNGTCNVVGCRADILTCCCPEALQVRSPACDSKVVACKSACAAFNTDEYCCRNYYNTPETCMASRYSEIFKDACPATYTYAYDKPSLIGSCDGPKELKVIFCN